MSKPKRIFLILLVQAPLLLHGDALILSRAMTASTIAEFFVERDHVRVELEIAVRDLPAFRKILPAAIHDQMGFEPEPLHTRLERFFTGDFVIQADGETLHGEIRLMEPRIRVQRDEITGEPLPDPVAGEDVLFVQIFYPFNDCPVGLSFRPPSNEQGFVAATIGMMVYHRGLPVMDFRYLSREEILKLDWEDPWYSQFENRNLRRQYNEPVSVFLYAEHFETRIEVIVRPTDIQQWLDLGITGMATLPVEIQSGLKDRIAEFLLTRMKLEIDGEPAEPQLQRINFLNRTLRSSTVIDPPQELDAVSATLGVIYSVPTDTLPQESRLTWNLFSPKMQVVRSASVDEAGPLPYKLRPDDPVLVWKNFLKDPTVPGLKPIASPHSVRRIRIPLVPLLALGIVLPAWIALRRGRGHLAAVIGAGILFLGLILSGTWSPAVRVPIPGRPRLSEAEQRALAAGLLGNVYSSFDYRGESAVYDALAQSLSGNLLADVYLDTMKSLELASQGGARVKVKAVELNEALFKPNQKGFSTECSWSVRGSVGHWGHIHERMNRYHAMLHIEETDGVWKITRLEVMDEKRAK